MPAESNWSRMCFIVTIKQWRNKVHLNGTTKVVIIPLSWVMLYWVL